LAIVVIRDRFSAKQHAVTKHELKQPKRTVRAEVCAFHGDRMDESGGTACGVCGDAHRNTRRDQAHE
jgi:hypothetical protein